METIGWMRRKHFLRGNKIRQTARDLRASRSPRAVAVRRPGLLEAQPLFRENRRMPPDVEGARNLRWPRAILFHGEQIVSPLRAPVCEPRGLPAHHLRCRSAIKSQLRSGSRFYYAAIEMPRRVREHRHHHGEAREKRQSANRQAAGNGESPDGHHLRVLENRCQ